MTTDKETTLDKIKKDLQNGRINELEAFYATSSLLENIIGFVEHLLEKEIEDRKQLSKNLDLYREKKLTTEYKKTFSSWNKSGLVIWDLKDILCRLGENVD